jgi:predicted O-linked N-acetylglucosamine transferase (SPINDLY family)
VDAAGEAAVSAAEAALGSTLREVGAALGLPQDGFVMASFGNIYKINEALFKTWLEILREVPQATLWLINDNSLATHNLRRYAQQSGIDPARIVFTPRVAHEEFRGQLRLADVFLDTFPYNCGSTTNDVIEAGTPMVTLSGNSMVSRMGGSARRGQMSSSSARTSNPFASG